MRLLWLVLAVAGALALQTTLARFWGGVAEGVNLVLVVVVYASLVLGPVTGMLTGSGAGLVQDALSGGVIGIGGLAKATVGFLCGAIAQQVVLAATVPRLMIFFAATVGHAAVFMGLYTLLDLRTYASPWATVAVQGAGNAVAGVMTFAVIEGVPRFVQRRRIRRRSRL